MYDDISRKRIRKTQNKTALDKAIGTNTIRMYLTNS